MEQVSKHSDAALLDLCSARIFGVVDEVAVQVFPDDPLRLRFHPGGDEGREVASGIPLQSQILRDQPRAKARPRDECSQHIEVGIRRKEHIEAAIQREPLACLLED